MIYYIDQEYSYASHLIDQHLDSLIIHNTLSISNLIRFLNNKTSCIQDREQSEYAIYKITDFIIVVLKELAKLKQWKLVMINDERVMYFLTDKSKRIDIVL